ncbi:hypothetical protein NVP3058O_079 [Vibrio phage 3.058.O._10N.286.46.B8]|nr:hypothetical protein NVP2058O_080 [Vibrio phage 2.058.O._10N.286.46.B8]AUS03149.1 hypothetical protein NVP3058O_079 [Vibrio phage 3.058.O._10N.286.46.B8]
MKLTSGQKVFYCGKLCWVFVGYDPESGSPVLKDTITKKFIVADINRISLPDDLKQTMLEDVERAFDEYYGTGLTDLDMMRKISTNLYDCGYTDGNPLSAHTMLGIIINSVKTATSCGAHSRSDFEYSITEALFGAGIRKNKIVVADVRV